MEEFGQMKADIAQLKTTVQVGVQPYLSICLNILQTFVHFLTHFDFF